MDRYGDSDAYPRGWSNQAKAPARKVSLNELSLDTTTCVWLLEVVPLVCALALTVPLPEGDRLFLPDCSPRAGGDSAYARQARRG